MIDVGFQALLGGLMWWAMVMTFLPGPWNGRRYSDIEPMFPRTPRRPRILASEPAHL